MDIRLPWSSIVVEDLINRWLWISRRQANGSDTKLWWRNQIERAEQYVEFWYLILSYIVIE